ncbi:hypothetical protein FJTKL_15238 [Diaporthe vaccinii]|uniref:EF-hand domain-containing protein n=1 Tax=Diaporthe vaccinii TaxID=105482 RepID=A0ABR4E5J3_9PEZI
MALPAGHLKSSSQGGGFGSSRSSPFRRPESPASPSPLRHSTPTASPAKSGQTSNSSRFAASTPTGTTESLTPRGQTNTQQPSPEMFGSPRVQRPAPVTTASSTSITGHSSALSQLQPAQVRTLREGFQILDRDSDGTVNREDVADMLNQLGRSTGNTHAAPNKSAQGCNVLTSGPTPAQAYRLMQQKYPASSLLPVRRSSRSQLS